MASAFHQWEADPLFSAAEVVQDSADRMESVFRLLQHEQSIVQGDHPDPKLLASIEYHRRDLATTLETAKWQLEDFEREVNLSAIADKSQTKQNVISRHRQFIRAIGEQIVHVEKSLKDTSVGDQVRNTEWVNLNEQDRDGLAMFLSGGKPIEHAVHHELEERNILRRFLDPTASSSFNDEINESNTGKTVKSNMNGLVHSDHNNNNNNNLEDNRIADVGSHYLKQMDSDGPSSVHGIAYDRHEQDGSWDLEANEGSFLHKNKLRGFNSKMKVFRSLGNLMSAYGANANRSFTKRWKDGEEQRHSSSYNDLSHVAQGHFTCPRLGSGYNNFRRFWLELLARIRRLSSWLGDYWPRYRRSRLSIQLITLMLLTLVLLGLLLSWVV